MSDITRQSTIKIEIQNGFINGLTEAQREILVKTSVFPVLTEELCVKRTGLPRLEIRQELDKLSEQGKLMQLSEEYPINPSYKCHDFYREYLIECAGLEERALRLEAAIDCLDLAFDNCQGTHESEIDDTVSIQLDRFIYQISKTDRPIADIVELVVTGSSKSEDEITDLIDTHLGLDRPEYSLEDYLIELI